MVWAQPGKMSVGLFLGLLRIIIMTERPIEILLVEDSPSDTDLCPSRHYERPRCVTTRDIVEDGVQAMKLLRREAEYANAPRQT